MKDTIIKRNNMLKINFHRKNCVRQSNTCMFDHAVNLCLECTRWHNWLKSILTSGLGGESDRCGQADAASLPWGFIVWLQRLSGCMLSPNPGHSSPANVQTENGFQNLAGHLNKTNSTIGIDVQDKSCYKYFLNIILCHLKELRIIFMPTEAHKY